MTVVGLRLAASAQTYVAARRQIRATIEHVGKKAAVPYTPAVTLKSGWLPGSAPVSTEASTTPGRGGALDQHDVAAAHPSRRPGRGRRRHRDRRRRHRVRTAALLGGAGDVPGIHVHHELRRAGPQGIVPGHRNGDRHRGRRPSRPPDRWARLVLAVDRHRVVVPRQLPDPHQLHVHGHRHHGDGVADLRSTRRTQLAPVAAPARRDRDRRSARSWSPCCLSCRCDRSEC